MGIGAKDQTNYLVAGSSRNVSQDSGEEIGRCSREDVQFWVNSECVERTRIILVLDLVFPSGQIVVSMICKKQRS